MMHGQKKHQIKGKEVYRTHILICILNLLYLPYARTFTSFGGTVPCHKSITVGL